MESVDFSLVLPLELSLNIFEFLGPQDLARAVQVCRSWNRICSLDFLWKEAFINAWGPSNRLSMIIIEHFDWKTVCLYCFKYFDFKSLQDFDAVALKQMTRKVLRDRVSPILKCYDTTPEKLDSKTRQQIIQEGALPYAAVLQFANLDNNFLPQKDWRINMLLFELASTILPYNKDIALKSAVILAQHNGRLKETSSKFYSPNIHLLALATKGVLENTPEEDIVSSLSNVNCTKGLWYWYDHALLTAGDDLKKKGYHSLAYVLFERCNWIQTLLMGRKKHYQPHTHVCALLRLAHYHPPNRDKLIQDADRVLQQVPDDDPHKWYNFACVAAMNKNSKNAQKYIELALRQPKSCIFFEGYAEYIQSDEDLSFVKHEPWFTDFLKKLLDGEYNERPPTTDTQFNSTTPKHHRTKSIHTHVRKASTEMTEQPS